MQFMTIKRKLKKRLGNIKATVKGIKSKRKGKKADKLRRKVIKTRPLKNIRDKTLRRKAAVVRKAARKQLKK